MMPHLLDEMIGVCDWAPPGWHWEVLPSGACSLVRNPGRVVNLELLWWRSCGLGMVQREPAPEEVVHQRITEEDEHIRRYMYMLERFPSRTWSILLGSHISYDPMSVHYLWVFSAHGSAPGRRPV
jgi:hypothetical protein